MPTNWQARLQPLKDENDKIIALVAEIHDIAVSKLIAGREKDFIFLKDLFFQGVIEIETFAERVVLVKEMPQSPVLIERLKTLATKLSKENAIFISELLTKL